VTSYAIPGDWAEHAASGGEKGVGQTREARRTIERRKTICASCPVLDDCLAWATTPTRPRPMDDRRRPHPRRTPTVTTTEEDRGMTVDPLLVVDADGRITILWPDPMPEYVRITPDALSQLVRELDVARGRETP
jgi:hypothetical protein